MRSEVYPTFARPEMLQSQHTLKQPLFLHEMTRLKNTYV